MTDMQVIIVNTHIIRNTSDLSVYAWACIKRLVIF